MRIFQTIKEIWKKNYINYFISCGIVGCGCFFIVAKNKMPLDSLLVVIPLGMFLTLIFMYTFASFLGGND